MCEYCENRVKNKPIRDTFRSAKDYTQIIRQNKFGYVLEVNLRFEDDGFYSDVSDFFQIKYCPMCGRKLD